MKARNETAIAELKRQLAELREVKSEDKKPDLLPKTAASRQALHEYLANIKNQTSDKPITIDLSQIPTTSETWNKEEILNFIEFLLDPFFHNKPIALNLGTAFNADNTQFNILFQTLLHLSLTELSLPRLPTYNPRTELEKIANLPSLQKLKISPQPRVFEHENIMDLISFVAQETPLPILDIVDFTSPLPLSDIHEKLFRYIHYQPFNSLGESSDTVHFKRLDFVRLAQRIDRTLRNDPRDKLIDFFEEAKTFPSEHHGPLHTILEYASPKRIMFYTSPPTPSPTALAAINLTLKTDYSGYYLNAIRHMSPALALNMLNDPLAEEVADYPTIQREKARLYQAIEKVDNLPHYILTPAELNDSTNPLIQQLKEQQWTYTQDPNSRTKQLEADFARDLRINGKSASEIKNSEVYLNTAFTPEQHKALALHHSQAPALLAGAVGHGIFNASKNSIIFPQHPHRQLNLYRSGDTIFYKIILESLPVKDPLDEKPLGFLKGPAEILMRLHSTKGFQLEYIATNSELLKDLYLNQDITEERVLKELLKRDPTNEKIQRLIPEAIKNKRLNDIYSGLEEVVPSKIMRALNDYKETTRGQPKEQLLKPLKTLKEAIGEYKNEKLEKFLNELTNRLQIEPLLRKAQASLRKRLGQLAKKKKGTDEIRINMSYLDSAIKHINDFLEGVTDDSYMLNQLTNLVSAIQHFPSKKRLSGSRTLDTLTTQLSSSIKVTPTAKPVYTLTPAELKGSTHPSIRQLENTNWVYTFDSKPYSDSFKMDFLRSLKVNGKTSTEVKDPEAYFKSTFTPTQWDAIHKHYSQAPMTLAGAVAIKFQPTIFPHLICFASKLAKEQPHLYREGNNVFIKIKTESTPVYYQDKTEIIGDLPGSVEVLMKLDPIKGFVLTHIKTSSELLRDLYLDKNISEERLIKELQKNNPGNKVLAEAFIAINADNRMQSLTNEFRDIKKEGMSVAARLVDYYKESKNLSPQDQLIALIKIENSLSNIENIKLKEVILELKQKALLRNAWPDLHKILEDKAVECKNEENKKYLKDTKENIVDFLNGLVSSETMLVNIKNRMIALKQQKSVSKESHQLIMGLEFITRIIESTVWLRQFKTTPPQSEEVEIYIKTAALLLNSESFPEKHLFSFETIQSKYSIRKEREYFYIPSDIKKETLAELNNDIWNFIGNLKTHKKLHPAKAEPLKTPEVKHSTSSTSLTPSKQLATNLEAVENLINTNKPLLQKFQFALDLIISPHPIFKDDNGKFHIPSSLKESNINELNQQLLNLIQTIDNYKKINEVPAERKISFFEPAEPKKGKDTPTPKSRI